MVINLLPQLSHGSLPVDAEMHLFVVHHGYYSDILIDSVRVLDKTIAEGTGRVSSTPKQNASSTTGSLQVIMQYG